MEQGRKETQISKIGNLPREIILDILSRLPITSLFQIKLVCRSWSNISQDRSLVPMRLSHTKNNDPCLILQILPVHYEMCLVGFSTHNQDNGMVKRIRPMMTEFHVEGSCNGFLCLFESKNNAIYTYHSLTRTCTEEQRSSLRICDVLGFGFHSETKEYKVLTDVTILDISRSYCGSGGGLRSSLVQINVLTIGSSTWRNLGNKPYSFVRPSSQVLVNGRLHWTTHPRPSGHWPTRHRPSNSSIISFDLADEQFREVERPTCGGLDNMMYQLVELRGCLSAAAQCNDGRMKIWLMKNYDAKESWINGFVIGAYIPRQLEIDLDPQAPYYRVRFLSSGRSLVKVLCLQKNNNILFQYNCRRLVSYDPRNGTFTEHAFPSMPATFDATVYEG